MNTHSLFQTLTVTASVTTLLVLTSACKNLPGSHEAQGATIGGVSGAAIGAVVGGSEHRLLGALIGGALGAGGGYLIGANSDRILGNDKDAASQAVHTAQSAPATPEQARAAANADVNGDGFVTMDEVVAVSKAGFSDQEVISRLRATGQIFELTTQQQQSLRSQGVSQNVLNQLPTLNREVRDQVLTKQQQKQNEVISQPQ